jgi:hypothetical protein
MNSDYFINIYTNEQTKQGKVYLLFQKEITIHEIIKGILHSYHIRRMLRDLNYTNQGIESKSIERLSPIWNQRLDLLKESFSLIDGKSISLDLLRIVLLLLSRSKK